MNNLICTFVTTMKTMTKKLTKILTRLTQASRVIIIMLISGIVDKRSYVLITVHTGALIGLSTRVNNVKS